MKGDLMNKIDFLTRLSSLSKDEINNIIKEKGKRPKPVSPLINLAKKRENFLKLSGNL